MQGLIRLYQRFVAATTYLQSPFLLFIRLYWGWQFITDGWGKLHHLDKVTTFFTSLNLPLPGITATGVATLEFVGGILLILGLGTRLIAFLLSCNMLVAFATAEHDVFVGIFRDPDKFVIADAFAYLFASLICLVFGAGLFSLDALLARRFGGSDRTA